MIGLIGGWQDNFWQTLKAARMLAINMAETHLRTGHDVVMPQLATRIEEVEGFEAAAARAGADYREIVLMADKQQALDRFATRVANSNPGHQRQMDDVVARNGGPTLLARIHDHLTAFLRHRADCVVLDTAGLTPNQTYEAVLTALGEHPWEETGEAETV